jgi:hypothetical protein
VATTTAKRPAGTFRRTLPGLWTLTGTWALLTGFALAQHGFHAFLPLVWKVLSGQGAGIVRIDGPRPDVLPALAAAISVQVLLAAVMVAVVRVTVGLPAGRKEQTVRAEVASSVFPAHGEVQSRFRPVMITLLVEELWARWLFLGLLGSVFGGTVMFYLLFLVGNGTWALVHLANYKDKRHRRQLIRVLPQFAGGILLTAVFAGYGLVAALMVHVGYDMLLFCVYRSRAVRLDRLLIAAYNVVLAGIAWVFMDKPLTDLLQWLRTDTVAALPGWDWWDYFWVVLFVCSALAVLAEFLLYDAEPSVSAGLFDTLRATLIVLPGSNAAFWLMGFVTDSAGIRILVIAIALLMIFSKSASGSGVARIFWFDIPVLAIELCAVFALASWASLLIIVLLYLVDTGDRVLRRLDPNRSGYLRGGNRISWRRG